VCFQVGPETETTRGRRRRGFGEEQLEGLEELFADGNVGGRVAAREGGRGGWLELEGVGGGLDGGGGAGSGGLFEGEGGDLWEPLFARGDDPVGLRGLCGEVGDMVLVGGGGLLGLGGEEDLCRDRVVEGGVRDG
jgi:hypothetical protein